MIKRDGRSKFTWELAEQICERLETGRTLTDVCSEDEIDVTPPTVRRWVTQNFGVGDNLAREDFPGGFAQMFQQAFEMGILAMSEKMLEVAADGTNDFRKNARGETVVDHDAIKRSELRVKTYQWYLGKMLPKIFGEKIEITERHDLKSMSNEDLVDMLRRSAMEAGINPTELAMMLADEQPAPTTH